MTINGTNYRLTKHGRKRFLQRVEAATDTQIIRTAVAGRLGYCFIWRPAIYGDVFRLITVLRAVKVGEDNQLKHEEKRSG